MKAAFRKSVLSPHRTEMIANYDGDWDLLKIHMCRSWGVEKAFDDNDVWEILRRHPVLLSGEDMDVCGYLYWLYDEVNHEEGQPVELFTGELHLIDIDPVGER